jgi:Domain of unknown function (DUF4416)
LGHYKTPVPVKLVIGLLGANPEILSTARKLLLEKFGIEEEVLEAIPFTWTNYYAEEIGNSPLRCFISYEKTIAREEMVDIKRYTNDLELSLSRNGLRPVNIDPGYMTMGQFFLATTKDQRQRVYIRDGIFIEPTLYFQDGRFLPFDWTYPDYRSDEYQGFMQAARAKLAYQMRHGGAPHSTLKANSGKLDSLSGKKSSPRPSQGEAQ